MPIKYKAQYGLMQAAAHGNISGIAPSVGREFVKETPKSKRSKFSESLMKKGKKKMMKGMMK